MAADKAGIWRASSDFHDSMPPLTKSVRTPCVCVAFSFVAIALSAQVPALEEHELVAVRDLLVAAPSQKPLSREALSVLVGDQEAPVIAVTSPEQEPEPWQVVLFFDRWWGSSRELRHAAVLLAGAAHELVAMGPVDLVVMDERGPEVRLDAIRDAERLNQALSWIALREVGAAAATARRLELVAALPGAGEDRVQRERRWERDAARSAQDRLLGWLMSHAQTGARRLLVPVGIPVLEDDGPFWQEVDEAAPMLCALSGDVSFGVGASALARTLAPLGWTVLLPWFGLQGEEMAPEESAWDTVVPDPNDDTAFVDHTGFGLFPGGGAGVRILLNEDRKPPLARKYADLAQEQLAAGNRSEAESAIRRAIFHFSDGKKTLREEARAWTVLADLLATGERPDQAARSYRHALALLVRADQGDAAPKRRPSEDDAVLRERLEVLALTRAAAGRSSKRLAEGTGGEVAHDHVSLADALTSLGGRWRVTVQLPPYVASALGGEEALGAQAPPLGAKLESQTVSVRRARGKRAALLAPRFVALATPLRALLAAQSSAGVSATSAEGSAGPRLEIWPSSSAGAAESVGPVWPAKLEVVYPHGPSVNFEELPRTAGPWRVVVGDPPLRDSRELCPPQLRQVAVLRHAWLASDRLQLDLDEESGEDAAGQGSAAEDPERASVHRAGAFVVVEDLSTGEWGIGGYR